MTHPKRAKMLEVIVSSLPDAMEAQAGGADRLEVVRELENGGLTPDLELVRQIVACVRIPVRVMLRENTSMGLKDQHEFETLLAKAAALGAVEVEGLVAGFIKDDNLDLPTLQAIAAVAPKLHITFHRAFDLLPDPRQAIRILKTLPQVDRILTAGGSGSWPERKLCLHQWQRCADPEIVILAGAGLSRRVIAELWSDSQISEIHIGRAARLPPETSGQVSRLQVAQLKGSPA